VAHWSRHNRRASGTFRFSPHILNSRKEAEGGYSARAGSSAHDYTLSSSQRGL
jgi:hypothetical protein